MFAPDACKILQINFTLHCPSIFTGPHPAVHAQEPGEMPLHLCYQLQVSTRGGTYSTLKTNAWYENNCPVI